MYYFRDYRSGKITKFLIVRAKEFKNGRYTGNVINRQITDLYGKTRTESMWGEEISERKEEQLKEDAKSDGRLDDFIFAKKDRGYLQDRVVMKGAYGGTLKRGVKLSQQSTSDVNWRK